jgi:hypothetical protein
VNLSSPKSSYTGVGSASLTSVPRAVVAFHCRAAAMNFCVGTPSDPLTSATLVISPSPSVCRPQVTEP